VTNKSRLTQIAALSLIVFIAFAALAQTPRRGVAPRNHLQRPDASAPTDAGPLLFLPSVTYDPGGDAWSVAVGDLNQDGKVDAAVVNYAYSVAVLLGNGDGTFHPPANYSASGVVAVAIADVNGDSKPDLLVGAGLQVGVLLGNGNGTFQPVVFYPLGLSDESNGATSIAVADVNRDGKLDLLVAGGYSAAVGVLLGNGDGTFRPAVAYPTADYYNHSVTVADVNGDGKPDLLAAGWDFSYGGDLGVLIGKGDGTFKTVVTYSTGPGEGLSYSAAVADVNGDGKSDVLVANSHTDSVGVMLGNGDGTFRAVVTYDSGGVYTTNLAVADVNADAKPDVLLSGWQSGSVGVLLGNGDGTFQSAVSYDSDGPATSLAVADLNGDGKPDLVVTNASPAPETNGSVAVLLNNNGAMPTSTSLAPSVNPVTIGQVVTYTATVASQSGGPLSGTVTFKDRYTVIATVSLVNNQAAFSTKYKSPKMLGPHSITSRYSGVFDQAAGSQSAALVETVRAPSLTALTTSGSPSMFGQPVTFTATVKSHYGTIPDGELVTFYDGSKVLASVALAGHTAAFTTSTLSVKTHIIKATYVGDSKFAPSSKKVTQVVQ
jgi:hypothetical protein